MYNAFRFAGWWGTDETVKFDMDLTFRPIPSANGFRLSNPCVLAVTALRASLDVFDQTSMDELTATSKLLTGYLEFLIDRLLDPKLVQIITPRDEKARGCQLSLLFLVPGQMEHVFGYLESRGIVCDDRKPDVIRLAPAPLYNTFQDVWKVVSSIKQGLSTPK